MIPLVLQVSMGGGDRLPSGDPSDRLPSYCIASLLREFWPPVPSLTQRNTTKVINRLYYIIIVFLITLVSIHYILINNISVNIFSFFLYINIKVKRYLVANYD